MRCRVCLSPVKEIYRDQRIESYRCTKCGSISNKFPLSQKNQGVSKELVYDREYFLSEYKEQYGKTYVEDEGNLRALARSRLERLYQLDGKPFSGSASLMDIGAALGYFLSEARKRGFHTVEGVEISTFAAEYCRDNLQIPIFNGPLENYPLGKQFDVISLFYVLEHFPNQEEILKKIDLLLNPGGWLLLALPSFHGPLYQFRKSEWFSSHPLDHFIDYSPSSITRVLSRKGFRVEKIYSSPVKWLRFPMQINKFLPSTVKRVLSVLLQIFHFGDTMEIYARKVD